LIKPSIHIIGGGTAALFLAAKLNTTKFNVTIYERNKTLGRKFLVAGDGGLNLSYNESPEALVKRYTPSSFFDSFSEYVTNEKLRAWFLEIGIETYIGSSNRIFPIKTIKPIAVLNTILDALKQKNVQLKTNHLWKGFSKEGNVLLQHHEEIIELKNEIVVFALGGGSWKITGSEGEWLNYFERKGIITKPFESSNCAFKINWKPELLNTIGGQVLKNCKLTCTNQSVLGEVTLTKFGIEGSGVYPLSPAIRNELQKSGRALVTIDLKPMWTLVQLQIACASAKGAVTDVLKHTAKLSKAAITLLKHYLTKEAFTNWETLTQTIKDFPIHITALAPLDEAISSAGGVDLSEINEHFEFKKWQHHYAIGEMLDWDAPTGGYLITGCYAQASYLAKHLNTT
jgi:uncharacterized flavoprotein (TIGR03862 family)